jgi:hypothetical protein
MSSVSKSAAEFYCQNFEQFRHANSYYKMVNKRGDRQLTTGKRKTFSKLSCGKKFKKNIRWNSTTMKLELFSLYLKIKNSRRLKINRFLTPTRFGLLLFFFLESP